jgi:DNA-binding transcriptional LysR family regulator
LSGAIARSDVSITMAPEGIHKCSFHPLFQDELRFITAPVHPWAVASRVNREEIPVENFVLYNKVSYTFRTIQQYFSKENIEINRFIELGSMEAIKELVKIGMGVGILAPWIVRKELEAHSLVSLPLGRTKLKRRWGISYQKGRKLNLIEETFVGLCESAIENMILENVITELA